ncbi:hypothetical protein ACFCYB_28700 [Streptomyces sp. NPDC056309]|uniref:hypothetical protein n=1 Tax=Streptomyces sp. NPDC056309 TaxID=3345781 RepID=UPI0035D61BD9
MTDVDAGGGDRMAPAVPTQYRMATTEQMRDSDQGCALSMHGTAKATAARRHSVKLITASPVLVEA